MSDRFYVYEHWRPDTNEPFYIGKGTGSRSHIFGEKGNRNLHHRAIDVRLSRLGLRIEVKIVARFETPEAAYAYEMQRIAHWRALGMELVNRTAGGEGLRNPSAETRELLAQWRRGQKPSEQTRAKMRASQAKRPRQTTEQIEKARRNRLAVARPMTAKTKALISAAQTLHWSVVKTDQNALARLKTQRASDSRTMWARNKANPEKYQSMLIKMSSSSKAAWTPERRAAQAEIIRARNARLMATRGYIKPPSVGPKKPPRNRRKDPSLPHGNAGKKMLPHVMEALRAANAGRNDSPETLRKKRDSWTRERRARQAVVARASAAKRAQNNLLRKMTPNEQAH